LYEWDITRNTFEYSDEIYEIYGIPENQREILRDLSHFNELVHPDDAEIVTSAMAWGTAGKKTEHLEFRIVRPDGSIRAVHAAGNILFDSKGNATKVIGFLMDVTDQKRIEEELRQSEEKYRQLFNTLRSPITLFDFEGNILHINKSGARNLGDEIENIVGKSLYDYFPDTAGIYIERGRQVARIGSRAISFEDKIDLPSGERRWFLSTHHPVKDARGNIYATQVISTDITELQRAEEERRRLEFQIQHAQKLESLGVLAGGIAHDFNNLLMGILGNADLALRKIPKGSPTRDHLVAIIQTSTRAADLCKQMLAYSGKGSFVVSRIDLNEIVTEMTHLLEVSVSKRASINYNFLKNLPAVKADATQIRQIVMNLITNASEAIGDSGGIISISTGTMTCDRSYLAEVFTDEELEEGLYVYLEVADTGCGMDAETQTKIFDPFYSTKFTGRGLGLSAVLGIVRGHGGAMKVYSEPGRGTTFKVLFPGLDLPAKTQSGQPHKNEDWRGSGAILLVDDDKRVLEVAKNMLKEIGFEVLTSSNGEEAIELFKKHVDEISCVLLDLTMPKMDGRETFRELRRIREDARVILSSGYNEQEVINHFAGKGLDGFIQKPYRLDDLVSKLKKLFV
jgi:two-component system cell cycle sensor histidine kinase/response regulator CckA